MVNMVYLPRLLEITLVLIAAWLLSASFVYHQKNPIDSTPTVIKYKQVALKKTDSVSLDKVNLFGSPPAVKKVETVQVAKPSRLNIKLIGTVVAGQKSAAMVNVNSSKQQQVFFIDEEIQPGVVLRQVEATSIVLDNRGKSERISLEKGKQITSISHMPIRSSARSNFGAANRNIDKGHLQKQMRNFSTLLSQARVAPHFTGKKADGFIISDIVKGSLYEEIGLHNGDVIQKVNGEAVTSAEQAMRMYKELQNASSIDVEINRGGSVQRVNYNIQ